MGNTLWLNSLKNALDSLENSMAETNMPEEIVVEVEEMKNSLAAIVEANQ